MYKLILRLDALNPVLQRYVVEPYPRLESLHITSVEGLVRFEGIYLPPTDHRLSTLGYPRVWIEAEFAVRETHGSLVYLGVQRFRLREPNRSRMDLMRLASAVLPGVQDRFLKALATTLPRLFILPEGREIPCIAMNLDYFLSKVPAYVSSLGEVRISEISIRNENRVHFFLQTTAILKNLVDFFGPEYLHLEELEAHRDPMELLWDPNPDDNPSL
ncbi:MAG: hypothetical protein NXI24_08120 [bacterium]|nr:hypothetical protein [bacterium]